MRGLEPPIHEITDEGLRNGGGDRPVVWGDYTHTSFVEVDSSGWMSMGLAPSSMPGGIGVDEDSDTYVGSLGFEGTQN